METKLCRKCGRHLPMSSFSIDNHMHDHRACYCRQCLKARERARKEAKIHAIKLGRNSKLVKFSDDELMRELSARLNYKLTF
jgi:hypothetical protein